MSAPAHLGKPLQTRPNPDTRQGLAYRLLAEAGKPVTVGDLAGRMAARGVAVTQNDLGVWLSLMLRRYPTLRRTAPATYQVVSGEGAA